MSYLDVPRLHFAGTFTADPPTINNIAQNYHATGAVAPSALIPSWNPYGSQFWTIDSAVQGFVDQDGQLHDSGDPLIGAALESAEGSSGATPKLVDLDVQQQSRTQLFGLFLALTLPGGESRRRKCSTRSGMSSRRSRSDGATIGTTLRRK